MPRTFLKLIFIAAIAAFCAIAAQALLFAPDDAPEISPPRVVTASTTPDQLPARIRIPSIGVDAAVQHVGVNALGNMAAPKGYDDAGWYELGTVPGQAGSAVLAGHVDNGLALAGVFKRLEELPAGAEIYIDTQGGETLRFTVERSESYGYQTVPLETVFNANDQPRLNLITCAGAWLKGEKTYDQRLVVYAVLQE